mgnify:CR=1 FL=1
MKSIDYITFNDVYNGIYQSQVIDVVEHLNTDLGQEVRLVAFVPLRLWIPQRKLIKAKLKGAKVYPIPGGIKDWARAKKILKFISKRTHAICRGPLAFSVAHRQYDKCVYDGRAAVSAEVREYNVTGSKLLDQVLIAEELNAVKKADFRIAVSQKLVEFWEDNLKVPIPINSFSVIPCTISSLAKIETSSNDRKETVKLVYAGGTGAWQSFDTVTELLDKALHVQSDLEVLFLSKPHKSIEALIQKFPNRVKCKWVGHNEVFGLLQSCDYGILIRDQKITNKVASPVKFAEYLNAGLKVLISEELGDFTDFTKTNHAGIVVTNELPILEKVSADEKIKMQNLSKSHFTKSSDEVREGYLKLIQSLK